jgi:hypothetical protein
VFVIALLFLATPGWAGLTEQIGATFEILAREIEKSFPPLEGLIVSVEGERLFLDLRERDGVLPGMDLQVFRKGEVFRHPITNQPLGRFEDLLGHAEITRVLPTYSEARFVPADGKAAPRAEDGVRITRARIKVAVAPLLDLTQTVGDSRRVPYMIALTLERTKRFEVVDSLKVQDLLATARTKTEELLTNPEKAMRLGRELQVSGWIVPVLLERRGVPHVDATWISAASGAALLSKRQPLEPPRPTDDRRFPWEPPPGD